MMSIIGAQMVGVSQGLKAGAGTPVLPWPNGSVLQAKLVPGEGAKGSAMLMLGGYRLHAEVPPNTQMGEVWLQIMGETMPAQFRILTQLQAHRLLMDMLRQQAADKNSSSKAGDAGDDARPSVASQGWGKMDGSGVNVSLAADNNRLLIEDDGEKGSSRGVVERQGDADHFMLHGRLDLDFLGSLAFVLEGGEDEPLRLRLFARDGRMAAMLRPGFLTWLQQQTSEVLEGALITGLPQQRGMQRDIVA